MKSLILKSTSLALGAALLVGAAGAGAAEAKGGHGHKFHGHGHGHHFFHKRHFYHAPVVVYTGPSCYWKWGKKFCSW